MRMGNIDPRDFTFRGRMKEAGISAQTGRRAIGKETAGRNELQRNLIRSADQPADIVTDRERGVYTTLFGSQKRHFSITRGVLTVAAFAKGAILQESESGLATEPDPSLRLG